MVTQKARKLRLQLTMTDYDEKRREHHKLSQELHREVTANCIPTRDEFATLYHDIVVTPGMMWDIALAVPRWVEGKAAQ